MQQELFKKICNLIEQKYLINIDTTGCSEDEKSERKPWTSSAIYFDSIIEELDEVKDELQENNSVYLEDELCDIFWAYSSLLYFLEKEGRIESKESVFKRCLKKYKGRNSGLEDGKLWDEIKTQQKQELLEEHIKKYGNKTPEK